MVREVNQDSFLVAEPLFAVADGMGGHLGGEVASATALEVLQENFGEATTNSLLEAVRRANAKVWDKGKLDESLHGMGTTLTAVARVTDEENNDVLTLVHVGDSRGYLFRDGALSQITDDHSLVEEMVRAGEISTEEAEVHPRRNIVTRALGVEPTVEADVEQVIPLVGDRILLCSDGLNRELTDDQIASVLLRLKSPDEAAKELVSQAKSHGGQDNITVVIVDVESDDGAPTAAAVTSKRTKTPKGAHAESTGGRITPRMVLFFLVAASLIGLACGSVVWYARAPYYVGLEGEQLVIYRGRPEPVLWFEKTLAQRSNVLTTQVLANERPRLTKGVVQSSLTESQRFITNLTDAAAAANAAAGLPPVTSAPVGPTTTAPTAPAPPPPQ